MNSNSQIQIQLTDTNTRQRYKFQYNGPTTQFVLLLIGVPMSKVHSSDLLLQQEFPAKKTKRLLLFKNAALGSIYKFSEHFVSVTNVVL